MSYSYCQECNNKYQSLSFCPKCNIPLQTPNVTQNIKGNRNQSVQINGDNQGNIVFQQPVESITPATKIYRQTIKPLRVGNTPLKNWWLFTAGSLGFAANIVTILSYFSQPMAGATSVYSLMMFAMIIGTLLIFTAYLLRRKKYITLLQGHTLEKDKQGNLYLTKIGGTCGLCNEPVRIKTVGPKECRQTRVVCTDNPDQHWCEFDRTVLMEVGEEYRQRQ